MTSTAPISRGGTGAALHHLRTTAGLTPEDVAGPAGLSADYLTRVENGEIQPKNEWVYLVAETIGEHLASKEQK